MSQSAEAADADVTTIPISSGSSVSIFELTGQVVEHNYSVAILLGGGATFNTTAANKTYTISSDGTNVTIHCFRNAHNKLTATANNIVAVRLNGAEGYGSWLWASVIVGYMMGYGGIEGSRFNALGNLSQVGPYNGSLCTYMGDQDSEIVLGFTSAPVIPADTTGISIDQKQETWNARSVGHSLPNQGLTQSFVPTHDTLAAVEVNLVINPVNLPYIEFKIFGDDGTGVPDVSITLATSTLSEGPGISKSSWVYPDIGFVEHWEGWFIADFPDIPVTIGERYYILVNLPLDAPFVGGFWRGLYRCLDPNLPDAYPDGESWWFVGIFQPPDKVITSDFTFRTYYASPYPSTNQTDDVGNDIEPEQVPTTPSDSLNQTDDVANETEPEQVPIEPPVAYNQTDDVGNDISLPDEKEVEPLIQSWSVDIDPDAIETKSDGNWITAYIELPDGASPAGINTSSISLNGILRITGPTAIGDHDSDGIPDLMVKFDRAEFVALVNISPGERIVFTTTISGTLFDGTGYSGSDTMLMINMPVINEEKKNHDSDQPASVNTVVSIDASELILLGSSICCSAIGCLTFVTRRRLLRR